MKLTILMDLKKSLGKKLSINISDHFKKESSKVKLTVKYYNEEEVYVKLSKEEIIELKDKLEKLLK